MTVDSCPPSTSFCGLSKPSTGTDSALLGLMESIFIQVARLRWQDLEQDQMSEKKTPSQMRIVTQGKPAPMA